MADYIKDLISGAVKSGINEIDYVVNGLGGGKLKIDADSAGNAVYETVSKTIAPTNEQKIEKKQKSNADKYAEINKIKKEANGASLTEKQQKEIKKLEQDIKKNNEDIKKYEEEIKKEKAVVEVRKAQKAAGLSDSEIKRQNEIAKFNEKKAEIQKNAQGRELTEDEKKILQI
jgi:2',3'-cyclic-nucleotide 2'-phosphodiesterase (5'-nucleotidase family)